MATVSGHLNNGKTMNNLRVFGMSGTAKFAEAVADHLDVGLSKHVEKYFPDKEPYCRADENVRGCDCYIIQSLYSDEQESVNDKFLKVCFFYRFTVGRQCGSYYFGCTLPVLSKTR